MKEYIEGKEVVGSTFIGLDFFFINIFSPSTEITSLKCNLNDKIRNI
jgi:hypothetical protein